MEDPSDTKRVVDDGQQFHEPVAALGYSPAMACVVGLADPWRDAKIDRELVGALEVGDVVLRIGKLVYDRLARLRRKARWETTDVHPSP